MDYLLVVDDHIGVRRLLCEFLAQEGFCVREAPNGQTALRLAREQKPRLVLLDLKMPGLSGMETLLKLKQLYSQIPVIVMSAYTHEHDIMEAVLNGVIEYYVFKPFDLDKLSVLLHDCLNNSDLYTQINLNTNP